jgi:hypothetical protein
MILSLTRAVRQRFEVGGFNTERRERLLNRAHHMQQRSRRLSHDLEHAHQAVSGRLRDNHKAGVVGQARRDWFAQRQASQEIRGQSKFRNCRKVPDARAGIRRGPILAQGIMVCLGRFIRELTLESRQQDLVDRIEFESECHEGTNSIRFSQRAVDLTLPLHLLTLGSAGCPHSSRFSTGGLADPRTPNPLPSTPTTLENLLPLSFPRRYAARMTTISKSLLIALALSTLALAQSAPRKSQAKSQTEATTPSTSENGKNQKDAAAKGSGPQSSMSGNHKDMMMSTAPAPNQNAGHSNNMIGNHKDVMMATAPAPSSGNKTQQSGTSATAAPAAQPTARNKSNTPDPNSPH